LQNDGRWRLVIDDARTGAWNMALDEAVSRAVAAGRSPATLRIYSWEPACLSIGYAQKCKDFDLALLEARGMGFVRRPSGGRAVLHKAELTYCLCAREDDPRVAGGVLESYKRLSAGFLSGLRLLGLQAALTANHDGSSGTLAACFDAPGRYELTAGGRKVIGSAQWRHHGAVLQHGSVPLSGDVSEVVDYLRLGEKEKERARAVLRERAATLLQVLQRQVSFSEAAAALTTGLAAELQVNWETAGFSDYELAAAERLAKEKYGNQSWNRRS